jgi:hypothetical protein
MSSAAPAAIIEYEAPQQNILSELRSAWADYQIVERRGLAFGQRLYELRAGLKHEVVQGGTTFTSSLDAAGIPRRTAHYWIQNYEISIGERAPKEEKQTKNADVVQVEHVTSASQEVPTRDEMPYRIEPSAPISEVRHWSPDREKRKNRSTPVKDFDELRTLAVKMLIAGYKELKTTGEYDNSHLYAAREWAQLSIADAEVVQ